MSFWLLQETVRYIKESERDRGVPVVPVDAMLGTFGIEVGDRHRFFGLCLAPFAFNLRCLFFGSWCLTKNAPAGFTTMRKIS